MLKYELFQLFVENVTTLLANDKNNDITTLPVANKNNDITKFLLLTKITI